MFLFLITTLCSHPSVLCLKSHSFQKSTFCTVHSILHKRDLLDRSETITPDVFEDFQAAGRGRTRRLKYRVPRTLTSTSRARGYYWVLPGGWLEQRAKEVPYGRVVITCLHTNRHLYQFSFPTTLHQHTGLIQDTACICHPLIPGAVPA